ncbi:MAG: thiopeptide-type bacteriocin biosynthesis protein [Nocardiopsis sp. BM-2018]|nr:MAG: thiopeptide-type bacteriocin biosynthesis protein [Nocardiopsis sp. BM-2018]
MRTPPPESNWWQVSLDYPDPASAEHAAAHHLAPALDGRDWFFIRKGAWRCRIRIPHDATERTETQAQLTAHLDRLVTAGHLNGWVRGVYEPETRAFGGPAAMDAAHRLWCADTRHFMLFLGTDSEEADGRRELAVLLSRTLMRAAGLDQYEQGDVWNRMAAIRPLPAGTPTPTVFYRQVHRLLRVDPGPEAAHFTTGAFAQHVAWARAFQTCGRTLASLAADGRLERGLRGVVAHHVLFTWNRLGIPAPVQAGLAHTAATVTFDPETVGL